MYQVTFSNQSSSVFNTFSPARQLKLIDTLSAFTPMLLEEGKEALGHFMRAGIAYYRYRIEDLRFYFTLKTDIIQCIFILPKNTWSDFLLRNNLEKLSETEIESNPNFLSLLEKHK